MGAPMQWTEAYLLGYPAMDATHRDFVDCVAALQAAGNADVLARLDAVATHLIEHFHQEEAWMADSGFPAAQCHADEHAAVLKSVREVRAMLDDGAQDPARVQVARDLAAALENWFPGHADYMDAALSHWMSKRAHGGAPVVLRRGVARTPEDSNVQEDCLK